MHSPRHSSRGHMLRPGRQVGLFPQSLGSLHTVSSTPTRSTTQESDHTMNETLKEIAHQLTRIADQQEQATMQITRADALEAWDMRIYEMEYLQALTKLGIQITD